MKFSVTGAATLIGVALMLGTQPASARPDESIRKGKALAVQRCGACHATGKKDASPLHAAPPFRSLAYRYPVETLGEALAEGISVGHPDMPSEPWEPQDIKRFVAYLNSIGPKPANAR
ncbi:MAG: cytochrome c [Rhizorhabdus sp.]